MEQNFEEKKTHQYRMFFFFQNFALCGQVTNSTVPTFKKKSHFLVQS